LLVFSPFLVVGASMGLRNARDMFFWMVPARFNFESLAGCADLAADGQAVWTKWGALTKIQVFAMLHYVVAYHKGPTATAGLLRVRHHPHRKHGRAMLARAWDSKGGICGVVGKDWVEGAIFLDMTCLCTAMSRCCRSCSCAGDRGGRRKLASSYFAP
jgi:hypothetical protein